MNVKTLLIAMLSVVSLSSYADEHNVCQQGEIVIRFSHVTNADRHPKGLAASILAQRINSEMDGKVCLEVYSDAVLYDDDEVLKALLEGHIQMAAPSLSKFEGYTKQFRIFDFPFIFKNIQAVDAFQASEAGQAIKSSMEARGIKGLEFWHNGLKQLSAQQPLIDPEDAKGLTFRVMASDVLAAQFETLGAVAVKLPLSEVPKALEEGWIQGQENTYSNIYGKDIHQLQKHITESNHGILDYLVVTSTSFWNGLPDDVRRQIETILREVTIARNAKAALVNAANKQAIQEAGIHIQTLSDAQRTRWKAAMRPVWDQFRKDVGAKSIEAAQRVEQLVQ